jgi:hypothetical protein
MPEQRLRLDLFLHLLGERAHGEALAHHLERDALADVTLGAAVLEERLGCPAQHVDETRRDRTTARVELVAPVPVVEAADRRDRIAADRDVALDGWPTAPVVERSAADEEVAVRGAGV